MSYTSADIRILSPEEAAERRLFRMEKILDQKTPLNPFGTGHELAFIRGLGKHSEGHGFDRGDLLNGYAAAIEKRSIWGDIDVVAVRQEISVMLAAHEMETA